MTIGFCASKRGLDLRSKLILIFFCTVFLLLCAHDPTNPGVGQGLFFNKNIKSSFRAAFCNLRYKISPLQIFDYSVPLVVREYCDNHPS